MTTLHIRPLHIRLFGDFQLLYADQVVAGLNQARQQSLLAYLLLHRAAPQPRQHLAFLFWPDSPEAQARANLRQMLHHLHHSLPDTDHFLQIETKTVQWLPTAPCTLDVAEFEDQLGQAAAAAHSGRRAEQQAALAAAVELYHGDLLIACYDEWILPEREQWRGKFIQALEQLILLLEEQRDYAAAIAYAQRLLRHDPLHETTYRHLMRLYASNGERASALRTYHTCVTVLQRELDVDPHPITQEAYARLLNLTPPPEAPLSSLHNAATLHLVGRQAEWAQLQAAWRMVVTQGRAHFVLIAGEAGIGKTRLAEELLTWADRQGIVTTTAHLYAAEGGLAYAPVTEWLRSSPMQTSLSTLDAVWLTEVARLLPELLAERPTLPRPAPLSEQWQRQRLFEALARAVCAAPGAIPLPRLLFIDDLQWCDGETLAWLRYLLHFAQKTHGRPPAPLLVIGAARAEEVGAEHPLTTLLLDLRRTSQVTEIMLMPLGATETADLAAQVANTTLDAAIVQRLYTHSEGNPLFVVETVRAGVGGWRLETKDLSTSPQSLVSGRQSLPPKVHAVIHHRLGQLSAAARQLAGLAATIGRSFTFALLQQAGGNPEDALVQSLDELWQRGIVRAQGIHAYDFSHDRIREAAYDALSPVQRPLYHKRVALALEQLYAEDLDPVSAQLAAHFEQAGMARQAIPYYQRAAAVAVSVLAHANAVAYLDAGLMLVGGQPRTAENVKQELVLLLAKASSLAVIEGFAVLKIAGVCAQVDMLLPQIVDDHLCFQAHQRLRGFSAASGKMERAHQHATHLLRLAHRLEDPTYRLGAYLASGIVNLQLGCLSVAKSYMEQGETLYREGAGNGVGRVLGDTGEIGMVSNLAFTQWLLGYPNQAHVKAAEAVALAERSGNPFLLSISPFFASMVYQYIGIVAWVTASAERMLALDEQYHIPISRASGLVAQGWVWAQEGKCAEGIVQMRTGIDAMKAMNHTMFQTHRLTWLAEAQMQTGDWETAAVTLDEAFAMSDQSGQRSCDAELHRLRGEWLVQSAVQSPKSVVRGRVAEVAVAAEAAFWQAIELARTQEAKSFELRAVMSLCRLWQRQGKRVVARDLLAEIYAWFTEGFDTSDLQGAKTLLDELSA